MIRRGLANMRSGLEAHVKVRSETDSQDRLVSRLRPISVNRLSLLRRKAPILLMALLPLMGCLRQVGGDLSVPVVTINAASKPHGPYVEREPLKIMTYNIRHGLGEDGVLDPKRIADVIRPMDIVILQEVDVNWARSGHTDQPRQIAELAGFEHYVYGPSFTLPVLEGGTALYGNTILSRHPIAHAERHPLPGPVGQEPRSALVVEVVVAGTPLTVIGTHLGLNADERMAQVAHLKEMIARVSTPVVLAGDFNARPHSPEIRLLSDLLHDSNYLLENTEGLTFPNPKPTARIDYIFTSPELAPHVLVHEVLHVSGSDHLPVVTHIDWAAFSGAAAPGASDNAS